MNQFNIFTYFEGSPNTNICYWI